jgi:hypothetical protein
MGAGRGAPQRDPLDVPAMRLREAKSRFIPLHERQGRAARAKCEQSG